METVPGRGALNELCGTRFYCISGDGDNNVRPALQLGIDGIESKAKLGISAVYSPKPLLQWTCPRLRLTCRKQTSVRIA